MAHIGRELIDVQAALQGLLDRWPRGKAASLDPEAQAVLGDADRLLGGIEAMLEPREETPGERAAGAARPRRSERDERSPGERAAERARSLATDTKTAAARRRREREGSWR